jgi:hypothetical protein
VEMVKKNKIIGMYLGLLVPTFFILSMGWYFFVNGRLYYCSDPLPILAFFPPFIHGSKYGDFWMSSKFDVYALWGLFLWSILLIPKLIISIWSRHRKKTLLVSGLILSGVFVWILWLFTHATSKYPGDPPSLNDPEATYRLVKLGPNWAISDQKPFQDEQIIYIGKSDIDFNQSPYLGQIVKIDGEYPTNSNNNLSCMNTDQQCIEGNCHKIFYWVKGSAITCAVTIHNLSR